MIRKWRIKQKEVIIMGKDRQEKKLKKSRSVESDRDQSLEHRGAATMEGPTEARKRNGLK